MLTFPSEFGGPHNPSWMPVVRIGLLSHYLSAYVSLVSKQNLFRSGKGHLSFYILIQLDGLYKSHRNARLCSVPPVIENGNEGTQSSQIWDNGSDPIQYEFSLQTNPTPSGLYSRIFEYSADIEYSNFMLRTNPSPMSIYLAV